MPAIVIPAPISSNNIAPVAAGGTGASTAADARTNLSVYSKSQAVAKADIVNNLTSTATDMPLSAAQGKALNDLVAQSTEYAFSDATTLVGITAYMNRISRVGNTAIYTLRGTVDTEVPSYSNGRIVVPDEYKPRGSTNIMVAYLVGGTVKFEMWQVLADGNVRCGDNIPTGFLSVSLVYLI